MQGLASLNISLEATVQDRNDQLVENESTMEDLERTNTSLEATVQDRNDQLVENVSTMEDLERTNTSLEAKVQDRNDQLVENESTMEDLERTNTNLEATVQDRNNQLVENESTMEDLERTNTSLEATVQDRNDQLVENACTMKGLSSLNTSLEATVQDRNDQLVENECTMKGLSSLNTGLASLNITLERTVRDSNDRLVENECTMQGLASLNITLERTVRDSNDRLMENECTMKGLEITVRDRNDQLMENASTMKGLSSLNTNLEITVRDRNDQLVENECTMKGLEITVRDRNDQLVANASTMKGLSSLNTNLEITVRECNDRLMENDVKMKGLEITVKDRNDQLVANASTMKGLSSLNTNLSSLNINLQDRNTKLMEQDYYFSMVGAAIQHSYTAALVTDNEFRILWTNDEAVKKILGVNGCDLVGSLAWELPLVLPGEASLRNFLQQELQKGKARALVTLKERSAIELLSISVRTMVETDKGVTKGRFLITMNDQTFVKQAQESKLSAKLAAASNKAKSEVIQMLSHELRTPLQGIMGVASTLMEELAPEENNMFDSLSTVLASSRVLLTLINNVLDLGKIDANMMNEIELVPIPLDQCVRETISFCNPFARLHDVGLIQEILSESCRPTVLGDRLHLQEILTNLISNSVKYSAPDTNVTISSRTCSIQEAWNEARKAAASDLTHLSSEELTEIEAEMEPGQTVTIISVRDEGRGIPEKDWNRVFGLFVQLDISKEKDRAYKGGTAVSSGQSSGSGLGLNLAMKLVTRMKGHLWFNNCDPGLVFSFFLLNSDDDHVEQQPVPEKAFHLELAVAARFKVLVVDDSMINLKVLAKMLSRVGVKQVTAAISAEKGLEILKTSSPDTYPNLIVSDLQMPGMDGFEFMGHLRELPTMTMPTIAACSADWSSETETRCIDVGFDSILRKPVAISDLRGFLANIAAEHQL
jgi:signal transduction histidine kinase